MGSKSIINIVATECRPEDEARFNKWYNEVHVPLLFKYRGMKRVTRYQRLGEKREDAAYLAIYEFESEQALADFTGSPERTAAMEEMRQSWKDGGFEIKWVAPYESLKSWER